MLADINELIDLRKNYLAQMFEEAERLANIFYEKGAQRVFLFGSLVNDGVYLEVFEDEAVLESDIDMAIVMHEPLPVGPHRALHFLTDEVIPRFALDLLVFSPGEFQDQGNRELLKGAVEIQHGQRIPLKELAGSLIIDRPSPRQFGYSQG